MKKPKKMLPGATPYPFESSITWVDREYDPNVRKMLGLDSASADRDGRAGRKAIVDDPFLKEMAEMDAGKPGKISVNAAALKIAARVHSGNDGQIEAKQP